MLGFEDVTERFLPSSKWARVYFDHVSQVHVRRIPEHVGMIQEHEIKALNPAFPPDYYSRILLGSETVRRVPTSSYSLLLLLLSLLLLLPS